MKKRGQAALEFMMTYGWAIIVVLVVIGGLTYSGFFGQVDFLPDRCILGVGMSCIDYRVESGSMTLRIRNDLGKTVVINSVQAVMDTDEICSSAEKRTLRSDDSTVMTLTNCNNGPIGTSVKGSIIIDYTFPSSFEHTLIGAVTGVVSATTSQTEGAVCMSAEQGGLCAGLDIVYGAGYEGFCCQEQGYCC